MPTTTPPVRVAQHSPLLALPSEIRLLIYPLALQNTVDDIKETSSLRSSSSSSAPKRPAIQGAIALLHTSSLLRTESSEAFNSLVQLERFQVRRSLGWADLADMAKAGVGDAKWKEVVGRVDLMRDVKRIVEWVYGNVQGR